MCKYIHFRYEQCNHQHLGRWEACWKDYWEAMCPCFPLPTSLCQDHKQSESFVVKPGKCSTCTKQEKEETRRDYGGFTAQATRGVGSPQEERQAQVPESPSNTHRSRGYQAQSQMDMDPQGREAPHSERTPSHGNRRTRHHRNHRSTNQRSGQQEQRNPYFERPRLGRRNAVRGRQVGNKVIMDRLPRPAPDPDRYYRANPPSARLMQAQDVIDRSMTVSPLTADDMRAPYVEIPLEDEYSAAFGPGWERVEHLGGLDRGTTRPRWI
ncbi:hypothetical protein ACHAPA_007926 [Fusarium lateritium]